MLELIGYLIWGLLLAALGLVLLVGARTIVEGGRGIFYPPTKYRPRASHERPIGWWTLLPLRWVGLVLIGVGLAIVFWAFWRFDAVDDCLDARGRWLESEQICEGAP
jgi:hypothetical protein